MAATEPFCPTEGYVARYGAVADLAQLRECLMDATRLIEAELASRGRSAADVDGGLLMQVCRQMANRCVPRDDEALPIPAGATQAGMTGGPYSRQYSFSAPYGSPKVTAAELALLGLSAARAGWVPLAVDADG